MTSQPVVVAEWSLLLAFGFMLIVLYRQFAYLLRLNAATDAHRSGLTLGETAPEFEYKTTQT
jgi:hypothetical protein